MHSTIAQMFRGGHAHAPFEKIVNNISEDSINTTVDNVPHSPWELLEHVRICQRDILNFIQDPEYEQPDWPEEYWPDGNGTMEDWEESVRHVKHDREALIDILRSVDVTETVPHHDTHTYLREALLVLKHTSYHLGQIVTVRRALGEW